jgi:hypothetical protein
MNIPLHEVNIQPGEFVALSEWRTTDGLAVNQVGYCTDVFQSLSATRAVPEWGHGRDANPNQSIQLVLNFLAKIFTARVPDGAEHLYKPSIAVTELLLSGDEHVRIGGYQGFGGLMYPTMAMHANGDNFALKLDFVNACLSFVKAHFIRVTAVTRDRIYMTWSGIDTANALSPDGTLIWSGRCEFWLPPI